MNTCHTPQTAPPQGTKKTQGAPHTPTTTRATPHNHQRTRRAAGATTTTDSTTPTATIAPPRQQPGHPQEQGTRRGAGDGPAPRRTTPPPHNDPQGDNSRPRCGALGHPPLPPGKSPAPHSDTAPPPREPRSADTPSRGSTGNHSTTTTRPPPPPPTPAHIPPPRATGNAIRTRLTGATPPRGTKTPHAAQEHREPRATAPAPRARHSLEQAHDSRGGDHQPPRTGTGQQAPVGPPATGRRTRQQRHDHTTGHAHGRTHARPPGRTRAQQQRRPKTQ